MADDVGMFEGLEEYNEDEIRHYFSVIFCHKLIREYMNVENASPELRDKFLDWLFSANKRKEKSIALAVVFSQIMNPTYQIPDIDMSVKAEQYEG